MHTLVCHEFLTEREDEGLSDPDRTRTVTLPNHTSGKHLECPDGHAIHLDGNGGDMALRLLLATPTATMMEGSRQEIMAYYQVRHAA